MSKPIVAIVGRPNVGKSTLFNKLINEKRSIVEDTPGVTRDRVYADCEWLKYKFTLIDTGGLEPYVSDPILKQMQEQTQIAIDTADVILFIVDIKTGITDTDMHVAHMLRRSKKKVLVIVNKYDVMSKKDLDIYEFYSLGLGDPIPVSSGQGLGLGDMLDEVVDLFVNCDDMIDDNYIKVAIIGKPNVGKSSLLNKIIGEYRSIVSDASGTTRDAVDSLYQKNGRNYMFIDTAGIRHRSKTMRKIEKYAILRTIAAIKRADVCVLLIDALEGISAQDVRIAGLAHENGKGVIIAVNKWDAIEKDTHTMNEFLKDVEGNFAYMSYSYKVFISAKTGQRINKLLETIDIVFDNVIKRITTGLLNEVLIDAMATSEPPVHKGRVLKIYYITQVSVKPPTFVLFVNDLKLLHFSYKRYIENRLRLAFGFKGTPIHLIIRMKTKD
jgi:GTP-binding protein